MEAEIKKLEAALSLIKEVADSTHLNMSEDRIVYNLSLLKLCNKYSLKINDVENYNAYNFCLKLKSKNVDFVICHYPYISNSANKIKFEESDYIELSNGNIGRLMFPHTRDIDMNYSISDPIWNEFKDELLSYNCIDYDKINFNYVYSMEDGMRLYQDFDSIYKKYAEKFNALYKVVKINKMKEELKKLEEGN